MYTSPQEEIQWLSGDQCGENVQCFDYIWIATVTQLLCIGTQSAPTKLLWQAHVYKK